MSAHENLTRMMDSGIVAVIRADSGELLADVAEALVAGGVDVMEVTFTVPNAVDVIKEVNRRIGDKILLGAGTVLDTETARAAILAGAEFIVSPSTDVEVIKLCRRYDKIVTPGVFTPTEAVTAWEAGADILKVFPADIGGPAHIKGLRGPLPQCRFMPTGGATSTALVTSCPDTTTTNGGRNHLRCSSAAGRPAARSVGRRSSS